MGLSKEDHDEIDRIQQASHERGEHIYPCTIVSDRYNGSYSGGKWIAYYCSHDQLPEEIDSGDTDCMNYWDSHTDDKLMVGKGNTPDAAFEDLRKKYLARWPIYKERFK